MFAIGFLSLLSIGFVAMSMGGSEDDADQIDEAQDDEIATDPNQPMINLNPAPQGDADGAGDEAPEYSNVTRNALIQSYVPIGEVDEATGAQIADFLEGLDPDQPIDEAADAYRSFVTGLGVEVLWPAEPSDETDEAPAEDADEDDSGEEEEVAYDNTTRNAVIRNYVPIGEVDAETQAQLDDFLEGLDPAQSIHEAAAAYRAYATELGVETFDPEDPENNTGEDVTRPPMGDNFRDPLKLSPERPDQYAEPQSAEDLVTVSDDNGEVSDALVLSESDGQAGSGDATHVVTAPEGSNAIEVGYDADQRFLIKYNGDTTTIKAGLNSILEGPEGEVQQDRYTTLDDEGNPVTELAWRYEFGGSTDILLDVDQAQIGAQVAQVSLVNQVDTLSFNFADDVQGNIHLFLYEQEIGEEGDSSTMMRAFIVQTSADQQGLSDAEIAQIARNGEDSSNSYTVLAEVFLGNDSVFVANQQEGAQDYDVWVNDFINSSPKISANVSWASVTLHNDADQGGTQSGGTGTGGMTTAGGNGSGEDISDLFEGMGLNPAFFGF